jgi:DNA-binding response OmpR family regulator
VWLVRPRVPRALPRAMSVSPHNTPVVLVADDEADLRSLVDFSLRGAGYEVVTAVDGDEALELALTRKPDLAVLDVRMPKLSGFEVTRRMREEDVTADTPILLLTAAAEKEDVAEGFAAGAYGYLEKPFDPWELLARVEAMLEGR